MLVDIIPTNFEDDIITRPEIKTYVQILESCRAQADYRRVKLLANARIENHRSGGKSTHYSKMMCQPRQIDTQNPGQTEALTMRRQHGPRD